MRREKTKKGFRKKSLKGSRKYTNSSVSKRGRPFCIYCRSRNDCYECERPRSSQKSLKKTKFARDKKQSFAIHLEVLETQE